MDLLRFSIVGFYFLYFLKISLSRLENPVTVKKEKMEFWKRWKLERWDYGKSHLKIMLERNMTVGLRKAAVFALTKGGW